MTNKKTITTASHTAFLVDYAAKGKDVNTPLNGDNIFPQLRGNLGTAIATGIESHFSGSDSQIPWVSKSATNPRTGAPTAYYLEDETIGIEVTDPDTGDKMLVSPIGAVSSGLATVLQMCELDTLEVSNRIGLKLSKKQCRCILDYIEGISELVELGFIIHTPKVSKIKKRNSIVLKSIKPSKKTKSGFYIEKNTLRNRDEETAKIDNTFTDAFGDLSASQKEMLAAVLAKHGMTS